MVPARRCILATGKMATGILVVWASVTMVHSGGGNWAREI